MRAAGAAIRVMATGRAWPILAASGLAWVMLAASGTGLLLPGLCGDRLALLGGSGAAALALMVQLNLGFGLVAGWAVMLLAMMLPLLWLPLGHVWKRSLAERRRRALLLFGLGYLGLWTAVLGLLWPLSIALRMIAGSSLSALLAALGLALIWQGSAAKIRFLKRAHALTPLPAFGLRAEFASLRFGAAVAAACAGACWGLMLLPMAAGGARLPVMAASAAAMLAERYAGPPRVAPRPPLVAAGLAALALAASLWN